ncbi:MAG: type III pantothenate kinase [Acidobacteria bacterium]|nr:type III pantothenate kinase [Acidobacteriota bacterium]
MLLVLDVGNTNTVMGVYPAESAGAAVVHWRLSTNRSGTVDEYGVFFRSLFDMAKLDVRSIDGIVVSSVVPPLDSTLRAMCERYFDARPLFIEPGIKTGISVLQETPRELGADRLVNSVAAFEKHGGPVVIVDFGTATTFDVVTERAEYIGGAIAPGLGISADALVQRTAKLPRVDIRPPAHVIGTNTTSHLQSGLYYGYLGLVDGILERMLAELGRPAKVVATGGLAALIGPGSQYITEIDDLLTLDGLRIIWERNKARRKTAEH